MALAAGSSRALARGRTATQYAPALVVTPPLRRPGGGKALRASVALTRDAGELGEARRAPAVPGAARTLPGAAAPRSRIVEKAANLRNIVFVSSEVRAPADPAGGRAAYAAYGAAASTRWERCPRLWVGAPAARGSGWAAATPAQPAPVDSCLRQTAHGSRPP